MQIESDDIAAAIAEGDIIRFLYCVEQTSAPVPHGIWRKLQRWSTGANVPLFDLAAMLEAAIECEPLPAEPADVRAALLDLDPRDLQTWVRLLFMTKVFLWRGALCLVARLIERRLGRTWATGFTPRDVAQWQIPMLTPAEVFADGVQISRHAPSWITRPEDVARRSWRTRVFEALDVTAHEFEYTATKDSAGVVALQNGIVFGKIGNCFIGNERVSGAGLRVLGHDYPGTALLDILELTLERKDSEFVISDVNILLICDAYFGNYFHSLIDYATRLADSEYLISQYGFRIGIPHSHASLMLPILAMLGLEGKTLVLPETPTVFLNIAIAASPQREHYCHPTAILWLRERALAQIVPRSRRRIYISRQDATSRRIVNEAALVETLARYGLEVIVPSTLSIAEQCALFASAEVIVAPHGAALSSLVVCAAGTKVIEIAADFGSSICFTHISHLLGLDHVLVRATAEEHDLLVGIGDVQNALAALGVAPVRVAER